METDVYLYFIHVVPFIGVVYLIALAFLHSQIPLIIVSLLGGLVTALINVAVDLLAFNLHWWHYTATGLILHLPLPFYTTQWLVYGSIVFLLIRKFWKTSRHWLALLLLIGAPLFGFALDIVGVVITKSSYQMWDSPLAGLLDCLLWLVMFYGGFLVFWSLALRQNQISLEKPAS